MPEVKYKVKIKYKKGEEVKFISHLDLMRAFQRAIRRAGIPIAYSQGFNPHMKISWGKALKVGETSESEEAELTLEKFAKPKEILEKINKQLPKGLEIIEAYLV